MNYNCQGCGYGTQSTPDAIDHAARTLHTLQGEDEDRTVTISIEGGE